MNRMIYETTNYQVNVLKEPVPIEQKGAVLYFNYEVVNKRTGCSENYSQHEPFAMDLANNLTEALEDLLPKVEVDSDGVTNVVSLN